MSPFQNPLSKAMCEWCYTAENGLLSQVVCERCKRKQPNAQSVNSPYSSCLFCNHHVGRYE